MSDKIRKSACEEVWGLLSDWYKNRRVSEKWPKPAKILDLEMANTILYVSRETEFSYGGTYDRWDEFLNPLLLHSHTGVYRKLHHNLLEDIKKRRRTNPNDWYRGLYNRVIKQLDEQLRQIQLYDLTDLEEIYGHRLNDLAQYRRNGCNLRLGEDGFPEKGYYSKSPSGDIFPAYQISQFVSLILKNYPWETLIGILKVHSDLIIDDEHKLNGSETPEETIEKWYEQLRMIATEEWGKVSERKTVMRAIFEGLKDNELLDRIWELYNIEYMPEEFYIPRKDAVYTVNIRTPLAIEELGRRIREYNGQIKNKIDTLQEAACLLQNSHIPHIGKERSKIARAVSEQQFLLKKLPSSRVYGRRLGKKDEAEITINLVKIVSPRIKEIISKLSLTPKEEKYWEEMLGS